MARPLRVLEGGPGLDQAAAAARRYDEFGFDPEFTESLLPAARWLYETYFRVETEGVENVPAEGRCLLVANHAGVIPYDGAMVRTAIWLEHPYPRHARMLVADWAFRMPFTSAFMLRTGNVMAHPANAARLLEREELVGVFPEGVKGAAKPYTDRYRVRRFGRGGFSQVALRTRSPIVPVAIVGAEEIHPVVFDVPALAELFGLPVFPVTPTFPLLGLLGLVPLPSKWLIAFGKPIDVAADYGPDAAGDPAVVLELSERVRSTIQAKVYELLPRRQTPFW